MIPIRFANSNIVFTKPPQMEGCHDVHAYKGCGQCITCWQPSPEERTKIAMGEPVWLCLIGETMQPALITADYPFAEVQP